MHVRKRASISVAALSLLALVACSASTAHIGDLKMGKDKDITSQVTTFAPQDHIYAAATAANLPSKVTMKWTFVAENVKGQPPNSEIQALDKSYDLDSDGTATYDLSPPPAGWPAGTYKLTITMMDDGTQRDQKTQEFTVSSAQ